MVFYTEGVFDQAEVSYESKKKIYIGCTEDAFKKSW